MHLQNNGRILHILTAESVWNFAGAAGTGLSELLDEELQVTGCNLQHLSKVTSLMH